jgi:uncharacterized protein (TIRG00374 family)
MQDLRGIGRFRTNAHKKCVSVVVRILVAFGALGLVFSSIEWDKLKAAFSNMNGWVFLGVLAVYVASQVLLAVRWLILVRAQGIELKLFPAIKLHFIGLFYNNAMPSSVGGDFLRAWYVSKHTEKRVEAALSVFVDRAMGLMGILLIALFSYIFLLKESDFPASTPANVSGSDARGRLLAVSLWGLAVLVSVLGAGLMNRSFRGWAAHVSMNIWRRLRLVINKGTDVVSVYWMRPMVLVVTLALTLVLQSVSIWAYCLLGRDLGIEAGMRYSFVIFPGMWVVGALPISIAGVGVMEGGIAFLFAKLAQVPLAQGTCLSLCQRFIWLISSVPGGIVHLMGRHLPEAFSFDEEQEQG